MKYAVIATGGHQYVVKEGDQFEVELVEGEKGKLTFEPLMIFDEKTAQVGTPNVKGSVTATIVEESIKNDKVMVIRYKAKKRVKKIRGHRQNKTVIKIDKIA